MATITVNGHEVEEGCWGEGHRGQYLPDHVYELAVGFGYVPSATADNVLAMRTLADMLDGLGADHMAWERHMWADDATVEWLNENTTNGTWGYDDGEFFLEANDDWAEDAGVTEAWVCHDCYMAHHGYDDHLDENGRTSDGLVPLHKLDDAHDVTDWTYSDGRRFSDDGMDEFSSRSCDGCGSTLGGSRSRLAVWPDPMTVPAVVVHTVDHRGMKSSRCPVCDTLHVYWDEDDLDDQGRLMCHHNG